MFAKAIRMKLRFPHKGVCTTEDLWDLTPKALDEIYRKLRKEQKELEEDSLLIGPGIGTTKLNLQVDIIKHVVATKLNEAEERIKAAEKKEQKGRIMEIIAHKQDEALAGKSVDELTKLLEKL